jgi:hypothetical protein
VIRWSASETFIELFHSSVATCAALNACSTPGTAALEATGRRRPTRPAVWVSWKTGAVLSSPPVKLNAFSVSPQGSDAEFLRSLFQYPEPPSTAAFLSLEFASFNTSVIVHALRVLAGAVPCPDRDGDR